MAAELKNFYWARPDRREVVESSDFCCRILVSPYNRRITICEFDLARDDGAVEMIRTLADRAAAEGLDKIWLKTGAGWERALTDAGMRLEATIPGYYRGEEPALVYAMYLSARRQTPSNPAGADLIKKLVAGPGAGGEKRGLPAGITLQWGGAEHCQDLAGLYGRVYATYPFPVYDPDYVKYTIEHDVCYLTARYDGELVAAASAEINCPEKNAEMTDFATLPEWRGRGLAGCLLARLESRHAKEGLRCFYTIARSGSVGMNKVFAGAGYTFHGVLLNNCDIGGGFEDMNVWSKLIGPAAAPDPDEPLLPCGYG